MKSVTEWRLVLICGSIRIINRIISLTKLLSAFIVTAKSLSHGKYFSAEVGSKTYLD